MPIKTEVLNNGLVTARDSALLNEGELQAADDCVYRPNTTAIYKVTGRSTYGSVTGSAAAVKGARYLSFEDGNSDLIVAYSGTSLYAAPYSGATGTFAVLGQAGTFPNNGVPSEILDSINYENSHFLIFGVGGGSTDNGKVRVLTYIRPAYAVVANCTTTNGLFTITTATANGFANAVPGQAVSGTNIPANTVVVTKDSNTQITVSNASTGSSGAVTVTFSGLPTVSLRYAGMQAVSAFGNNGATSSDITTGAKSGVAVVAGVWPTTSDLGAGYYYFLYTELILNGNDELVEGTSSIPAKDLPFINITTPTTQGITVCFELPINNGGNGLNLATHFQLYMSDKLVDALPAPSLATFRRVGSPIAITSLVTKQTYTFTETTTAPQGGYLGTAPVVADGALPEWDNKNFMITGPLATSTANNPPATNLIRNFGFINTGAYASAVVLGVEITFIGATVGGDTLGSILVAPRRVDLTKQAAARKVIVDRTVRSYTLGGPTDTWGVAWAAADFINTNVFEIRVQRGGDANGSQRPGIGSVRVKVYYTGTSINRNGKFFQTITVSSQVGIAVSAGANFPPPVASTGDIFEGQLVLNSISEDGIISYSLPSQPEYFPAVYKMRFRSKRKNKVTCIKVVNRALLVGMETSLKRVNYLPRENDPEFDAGRAVEELASNHGIVGPLAAATFTRPGGGPTLAYIAHNGPHMTDGVSTTTLNEDLDWTALVDPAYLKNCILVDYPKNYQLWLFYTPFGGTTNTKAIVFHYHQSHLKNGKLVATGPISASARCAFPAWLDGVPKLFTGHNTDGVIYLEDRAADANQFVDDSGGTFVPRIRTRRVYPNGFGGEAREERVWIRVGAIGSLTTGACTLISRIQNTGEALFTCPTFNFTTNIGGQTVVHSDDWGESFDLTIGKLGSLTVGLQVETLSYLIAAPTIENNQKAGV